MILLFGDKATKTASASKSSNVKSHPVENSGILAMGYGDARSLLTVNQYDSYTSSNPVAVNYAMYADYSDSSTDCGFMSDFSSAVNCLTESGFSGVSSNGGDCGASSYSGSSSGSFTSFG